VIPAAVRRGRPPDFGYIGGANEVARTQTSSYTYRGRLCYRSIGISGCRRHDLPMAASRDVQYMSPPQRTGPDACVAALSGEKEYSTRVWLESLRYWVGGGTEVKMASSAMPRSRPTASFLGFLGFS
jgi:hypothetical protein